MPSDLSSESERRPPYSQADASLQLYVRENTVSSFRIEQEAAASMWLQIESPQGPVQPAMSQCKRCGKNYRWPERIGFIRLDCGLYFYDLREKSTEHA
jgi:hypothetical protein